MSVVRRSFIALSPDADTRAELTSLIMQLAGRQGGPRRLRWSVPADLHLTLRFLGPVTIEQKLRFESHLPALVAPPQRLAPLRLTLWPTTGRPRVLVLLTDRDPTLDGMVAATEELARSVGFRAEPRAFAPHITLARVWGPPAPDWLDADTPLPRTLRLDRLGLFASTSPDTEGRRYRPLFSARLAQP